MLNKSSQVLRLGAAATAGISLSRSKPRSLKPSIAIISSQNTKVLRLQANLNKRRCPFFNYAIHHDSDGDFKLERRKACESGCTCVIGPGCSNRRASRSLQVLCSFLLVFYWPRQCPSPCDRDGLCYKTVFRFENRSNCQTLAYIAVVITIFTSPNTIFKLDPEVLY
jgi:hypothetical protein